MKSTRLVRGAMAVMAAALAATSTARAVQAPLLMATVVPTLAVPSVGPGPASGVYMIHPAGAPRDCLIMQGVPAGNGATAHLLIDVGCTRPEAGRFALVRHRSGRYTIRLEGGPRYCATVARGVVFGAPSIDFHACGVYDEAYLGFEPVDVCNGGERDQVFVIAGGPNYSVQGIAPMGGSPGVWDVGDYGPRREVKYWEQHNPALMKQRFTLERVGHLPYPIADCGTPAAPAAGVRTQAPLHAPPDVAPRPHQ